VGKVVVVAQDFPIAPLHYKALKFTMYSVLPVTHSKEDLMRKYNLIQHYPPTLGQSI